ncbi:HemK2/MTQ2 family protein methyltransferase [Actinomadura flavalba]|uniref:HemK2/MTQ2 family protein methyltransferase n=1 Tax=Actinomadura flavalba TaxID=1120938 RepID=UPI000364167D|nr:HemK2/MTQ2 family protein methyltransferase [Actinomadura flavalba]
MLLLRPPGVYRPQGDTSLLCEALTGAGVLRGASVLDVGTGTGMVALTAARGGARRVTAVDVSRRALLAVRVNALARGLRVRTRRGDLFSAVAGERFDVIVSNPPYVAGEPACAHGAARAWDAGLDGRRHLDRICAQAPEYLHPGGTLLMVHSALCGVRSTLGALHEAGLRASVVARRREPFGPVMNARAGRLASLGLITRGQYEEELVVIRADRAAAGTAAVRPGHRHAG